MSPAPCPNRNGAAAQEYAAVANPRLEVVVLVLHANFSRGASGHPSCCRALSDGRPVSYRGGQGQHAATDQMVGEPPHRHQGHTRTHRRVDGCVRRANQTRPLSARGAPRGLRGGHFTLTGQTYRPVATQRTIMPSASSASRRGDEHAAHEIWLRRSHIRSALDFGYYVNPNRCVRTRSIRLR